MGGDLPRELAAPARRASARIKLTRDLVQRLASALGNQRRPLAPAAGDHNKRSPPAPGETRLGAGAQAEAARQRRPPRQTAATREPLAATVCCQPQLQPQPQQPQQQQQQQRRRRRRRRPQQRARLESRASPNCSTCKQCCWRREAAARQPPPPPHCYANDDNSARVGARAQRALDAAAAAAAATEARPATTQTTETTTNKLRGAPAAAAAADAGDNGAARAPLPVAQQRAQAGGGRVFLLARGAHCLASGRREWPSGAGAPAVQQLVVAATTPPRTRTRRRSRTRTRRRTGTSEGEGDDDDDDFERAACRPFARRDRFLDRGRKLRRNQLACPIKGAREISACGSSATSGASLKRRRRAAEVGRRARPALVARARGLKPTTVIETEAAEGAAQRAASRRPATQARTGARAQRQTQTTKTTKTTTTKTEKPIRSHSRAAAASAHRSIVQVEEAKIEPLIGSTRRARPGGGGGRSDADGPFSWPPRPPPERAPGGTFMTSCDRARGGRRSLERALEPPALVVQWRWATGGGGGGKRAAAASRRQRLVHALLLSLLGALLLLANAGRPLLTPASCLQLSAPAGASASANASRAPGAASPPVARTTRAQDDEEAAAFSRAVMATMSTQSSVPARPLLARASEPGAAERQSADTAPIYAPDGELGGAEAPTTPVGIGGGGGGAAGDDEVESSDDLVVSGRRAGAALHEEPLTGEPLDSGATGAGALPGGLNSSANGNANGNANANGANGELTQVLDGFTDFARIFAMVAIMIGDICGNSLVILSVVRHSKLRVTTNWFVVSLACADILVALFAMTFNASVQITGRWIFPRWMCDFWNSCDVLASTASILHLCCISIDRYYAIMRPLDYPMKITTRRVCYALAVVWFSSALLSYIPIFTGVYTTSEHIQWQQQNPDQCEFVVNRVYAIVSSSISFWIPCCIMVFTYYKIYQEATRQEKFIYKAQSMMPAPQPNHHHHQANSASGANRSKQRRSKSMAITSLSSNSSGRPAKRTSNEARIKQFAAKQAIEQQQQAASSDSGGAKASGAELTPASAAAAGQPEQLPLTGSATDINNNNNSNAPRPPNQMAVAPAAAATSSKQQLQQQQQLEEQDERDSNSGQSTPTKRSISKMKREHKAAKTLGIIMGVFILCWLPFFSWYTPQHICGHACDGIIPHNVVTLLFWIGYFNSTLNPIIYAYFNHEFRDAFKKTLQWLFCCCRDLKCLRVSRPNDNQHYNCTYRSTQEIGLVTNG